MVLVGDTVSEAADYATREVEQRNEHPRMAVAQAVSEHGVPEERRETVLSLVQDQTGTTDGGKVRGESDSAAVDGEVIDKLEDLLNAEIVDVGRDENNHLLIHVDDQRGGSA